MAIKNKLKECIKEGKKGERHKGLRKIDVSMESVQGYIKKAIHNFNAMDSFHKSGYSDWSASASFYSLYHLLLAMIAKNGYEWYLENANSSGLVKTFSQIMKDRFGE